MWRTLRMPFVRCLIGMVALALAVGSAWADEEQDYYRIISIATPDSQTDSRDPNWKPSDEGIALEVSGIAVLSPSRVAVAIRKGEVWLLDGVDQVTGEGEESGVVTYQRFASALHEPLGLLQQDDSLITVQRTEMTRLRDTDGDDVADVYDTLASGWGVSGHYHEYAYGPKLDGDGNLWMTLNIGMGLKGEQLQKIVPDAPLGYRQAAWRGWGMKLDSSGELNPVCAGMRSPSGLGANADGDMFYTDQQGNWVATNSLHHMRPGAFSHHPESLASMELRGSTIHDVEEVPNGLAYPEALKRFPQMQPPAVWFPYKKAGQSATDILLDQSGGKFGPFENQLFVGEFTQASMHRVFLEKVNGEYQGACFPFRRGFASAVLRMAQAEDGSVYVGLTNRGWSSLGTSSYGLQRLEWTGKTPFEIQEMRAKPDGFELVFTRQVDVESASDVGSYQLASHTYLYQSSYGSDEVLKQDLKIREAIVSEDRLRVRLKVDGLRELFVHELDAGGVKDENGQPLLHRKAFYTLNNIPQE
ncbi:large, multifunctional secreted protein [Rhodopirellula islandica]|uniref:Large, multifunctional secreted protein n=2 Tax=Rhodopirellula islandica TaxID=595434 RepID=A0A0J1BAU3_RHOIS|nr:large, multifunctional secreted protein [Rhodopirellula islandica]